MKAKRVLVGPVVGQQAVTPWGVGTITAVGPTDLVTSHITVEHAGRGTPKFARSNVQPIPIVLEWESSEAAQELEWVKDVLAEHGYVGPLAPACCPLADWLDERK